MASLLLSSGCRSTPPSSGSKRNRGSPTFLTPNRPAKRQSLRDRVATEGLGVPAARVSLSYTKGPGGHTSWSEEEVQSLVEFILLMCDGEKWPTHQRWHFWQCAGEFVQTRTNSRQLRSGKKKKEASYVINK